MRDEEEDKDSKKEESQEYRGGPYVVDGMGSGLLEKARQALTGRRKSIDDAVKKATK